MLSDFGGVKSLSCHVTYGDGRIYCVMSQSRFLGLIRTWPYREFQTDLEAAHHTAHAFRAEVHLPIVGIVFSYHFGSN